MSLIRKETKKQTCYNCNGNKIKRKQSFINGKYRMHWEVCKSCGGTGIFTEYHCYAIDEKNKICFDCDTGK